jgi:hypothetical protein
LGAHTLMPFVVGGIAALVALAAGILAQVDPITSLWRAALAFVLGLIGANLWYVFTTIGRQPEAISESATPSEAGTS